MVGAGVDKEVEPSGLCDGLNMGSEGREVDAGFWVQRLNIWVKGKMEGEGKRQGSVRACHLCDG